MLAAFLLSTALALQQAPGEPPPGAEAALRSGVRDQGAVRTLDLKLGESVVLTLDADFKPSLQSTSRADAGAVAARIPVPIDLQTPETSTGIKIYEKGGDPRRLNRAAPGTVVMTLVPYNTGTLLLVENGLDRPFRYHAAAMQPLSTGGAKGSSTSLCPAKPRIGTVETWAARFVSLLIVKFEASAPGDDACRM